MSVRPISALASSSPLSLSLSLSLSPRRPPYDPPEEEGRKGRSSSFGQDERDSTSPPLFLFLPPLFPGGATPNELEGEKVPFFLSRPFLSPFLSTLFVANARRERSGDGKRGMGTGQRAEEAQWKREREGASFSRRSRERAKGFPSSFRSSPAHFLVPTARSFVRRLS